MLPVVEGKMEATKSLLFFGILTIAVWVGLGTSAFWLVAPLYGWLFLGFSAFSILIAMRRQMCGSCYYCASCTKGFAKLSKLFVGGTRIPGLGRGSTLGMAVFIYVLLSIIPGTILFSSMLREFSLIRLFLLTGLVAISVYNVAARGKDWCS